MAHPIEEDQLACSAFDAGYRHVPEKSLNEEGERYRGSRFVEGAEWTAKKLYENSASVRLAAQGLSKVGQGLNWIGKPLIQASEQNQTAPIYPGATIEGRSGSAMLGDVIRSGQWLIDKSGEGAEYWGDKINLDPRISQTIGKGAAEELLTVGTAKALKGASKLKINQPNIPALATVDNVPVSTLNRVEDFTPSNTFASTSKGAVKSKKVREVITKKTLESDAYKKWRTEGAKYYKDNFDKHAPMRGYPWFTDPETGLKYSLSTGDKTGEIINNKAVRNLTNISRARRNVRDAKRFATTEITVERAHEIANKFKQPPEAAEAFLKFQQEYKKHILKRIENINKRIKNNPNVYGKDTKASLGHLRAAERYIEGADMASNIDIEDFIQNITRSNLDEVSDQFNRGLGRSLDLEEEFIKFIDKDVGTYHGASGLRLGRHQSETAIKYVRKHMDDDIDWKSWLTDEGKQLFESKEDFLVNEAIEKFRGDKRRNLEKTLVDVRSNGFGNH